MGGSAARVIAGLQQLEQVDGDPDAGDAAVLDVRPTSDGEGIGIPVVGGVPHFPPDEIRLPAPGWLAHP
ncbi:hypothetical protein ACFWUQ_01760 [Streptomyces sp. NPDC058662]|uniref:hypothetical protein n=1 Tax=Streptomyces sp. NPDC058662 TaxID=3346583 RepID=UPI00366A2696